MDELSKAVNAVGNAARVAGELGERVRDFAGGLRIPGGMSNAARKAYNAAKDLKSSVGPIGTKALNAARTFRNAVRNRVNPERIANAASTAARYMGEAAQGAGSKMAQVGSTLGSTMKRTFEDYGGWKGAQNRAIQRSNPFLRQPTALEAAVGVTPTYSLNPFKPVSFSNLHSAFSRKAMPPTASQAIVNPPRRWFGGRTKKQRKNRRRS